MISPTEIRKKAIRVYPDFLSAILTRERFFPLYIKGNKGKATDSMETLYPALRRLLESEKKQLGYGYTVILKSINTRHAGTISMPEDIYFDNVEDYLKFIEKETEFLAFRKAVQETRKLLPELLTWMAINPMKTINHLEKWEHLLKVGLFFKENPRPNEHARALPIDVPTVFIESNQDMLTAILEVILPANSIAQSEVLFEEKFGLQYDEPTVRIRALAEDFGTIFEKTKDVSLPLSDWNSQEIQAARVFLIMDKMDFLRFPKKENSLAIWANEEVLSTIEKLNFLSTTDLYFWGNISTNAFQILADLRKRLPRISSCLMNFSILNSHQENTEGVKIKVEGTVLNLTEEENSVLQKLREGSRLLSKHIGQQELINL